jgi:hypothetical protein
MIERTHVSRSRSPRTGPVVGATALALLALAGCSSGSGSGSGSGQEPALGAIPVITSSSQIQALPLDAYTLNQQQYLSILNAQRVLARSCMQQFGFDWTGSNVVNPAKVGQNPAVLFLVIDDSRASQFGYHSPDGSSASGGKDPSITVTAMEKSVFEGSYAGGPLNGHTVPAGGCTSVVRKALTKGTTATVDPLGAQNDIVGPYQQSQADSRVVAAFGAWSTCMKAKGYSYKTPNDAVNDPAWHTQTPSLKEITTARADVACKHQANVAGIWWAALTAYESRYVEQHSAELDQIKQVIQAELQNSASALGGA